MWCAFDIKYFHVFVGTAQPAPMFFSLSTGKSTAKKERPRSELRDIQQKRLLCPSDIPPLRGGQNRHLNRPRRQRGEDKL